MIIDLILFIVLIICLYTDLTARKIYNFILLPAFLFAFIFHLAAGGLSQGLWSLQGLALGIALLFIPFLTGGIGAGDVKLLGTIGALMGPDFVLTAFLAGAIAGGVIASGQLIRHKKLSSTLKKIGVNLYFTVIGAPRSKGPFTIENAAKEDVIPYGAAIVIGTAAAYVVR
ncbi:MAG: prepilin peptidase [Firmicutes bacterium]|nr:prepilin peptidase [Bacillota bacterium]